MASPGHETIISLMLAVADTPAAADWYKEALGARVLWSLGSVAGLDIDGAPFFLHQPVQNGFDSPKEIGTTTVRVELFVDEPDEVIARAVEAGATGGDIKNHITPLGEAPAGWIHRPVRAHLVRRGQVSLEPLQRIVMHSRLGGRILDHMP